jgi:hypothetical protein
MKTKRDSKTYAQRMLSRHLAPHNTQSVWVMLLAGRTLSRCRFVRECERLTESLTVPPRFSQPQTIAKVL